jgi:hypothetical protein
LSAAILAMVVLALFFRPPPKQQPVPEAKASVAA